MRELTLNEIEEVNGGIVPLLIEGAKWLAVTVAAWAVGEGLFALKDKIMAGPKEGTIGDLVEKMGGCDEGDFKIEQNQDGSKTSITVTCLKAPRLKRESTEP